MKQVLGILAILVLGFSLSFGQTSDQSSNADGNRAASPTATRNDDAPREHNWGWIGLLGLAGLAGLRGRRQEHNVTERERNMRKVA